VQKVLGAPLHRDAIMRVRDREKAGEPPATDTPDDTG
jgi:hypothetical protein